MFELSEDPMRGSPAVTADMIQRLLAQTAHLQDRLCLALEKIEVSLSAVTVAYMLQIASPAHGELEDARARIRQLTGKAK